MIYFDTNDILGYQGYTWIPMIYLDTNVYLNIKVILEYQGYTWITKIILGYQ